MFILSTIQCLHGIRNRLSAEELLANWSMISSFHMSQTIYLFFRVRQHKCPNFSCPMFLLNLFVINLSVEKIFRIRLALH